MAVKLSRGLAKIEINFDGVDEPEFIYVNPTDTKLLERMKEAQKIIEEKAKAVEPYKLGADGLPEAEDAIRYVNETNQVVYDAIDYGFGSNVSAVLFKYLSPFAIVDGEYNVFAVLGALTPELERIAKQNRDKANKNVDKYLKKYQKK